MSRRHLVSAVIGVCAVVLVSGCGTTIQGKAVSVFDDPFSVAGMPATDGPTGLRDDAAAPTRKVQHGDDGKIDELARQSISDIEEFWDTAYGETFDGQFKRVKALLSWDANGYEDTEFCGESTLGLVNAGYCFDDKTIGWDRGQLLPGLRDQYGDMGVTIVLAHEYGHAIQDQADLADVDPSLTIVREQQADCFAGAYMRWVAEDHSSRFTLSTGEGLNSVMAAILGFRDPLMNEDNPNAGFDEHGSAFERASAFQFGFTDGAAACKAIDQQEVEQRRGDLPVLLPEEQSGEVEVTEKSVSDIVDAMNVLFTPANPPKLSFEAAECTDAQPTSPASFCPDSNTIFADIDELKAMGTKPETDEAGSLATGDNTAYSVVMARYMQAIQHEHGVTLDTAEAALRTACLTGVATTKLSTNVTTSDGNTIALTAGDIDEAVSGLLTNGMVASDVNGESVPSGFSRIDAFRVGVLGDQERCFARFE